MTVFTAANSRSCAWMSCSPSSSSAMRLMPIHSSSAAPTSCRYGSRSRLTAKNVRMIRSTTAPITPQKMPSVRCFGGRLRQASAITTALSPDNRMLMTMISIAATQNCGRAEFHSILVRCARSAGARAGSAHGGVKAPTSAACPSPPDCA